MKGVPKFTRRITEVSAVLDEGRDESWKWPASYCLQLYVTAGIDAWQTGQSKCFFDANLPVESRDQYAPLHMITFSGVRTSNFRSVHRL